MCIARLAVRLLDSSQADYVIVDNIDTYGNVIGDPYKDGFCTNALTSQLLIHRSESNQCSDYISMLISSISGFQEH